MTVRFTPRARDELDSLAERFAAYRELTAEKFLTSVRRVVELLAANPHLGSPFPTANRRLVGLRHVGVPRFPNHVVLYIPSGGDVVILHVVNGRRDLDAILASDP